MSGAQHMGQALGTDNPSTVYGKPVNNSVDGNGGGRAGFAFDLASKSIEKPRGC